MKRSDIFKSTDLRTPDLNGRPLVVTIVDAPLETLKNRDGENDRTVLYFERDAKPFILNMTNWDAVAAIAGDDTDRWPGAAIELYPTTTTMDGEVVPCIRIRAPSGPSQSRTPDEIAGARLLRQQAIDQAIDDDIPL
jgi:hypothetical protein